MDIAAAQSVNQAYRSSTASKTKRDLPQANWGAVEPAKYIDTYGKLPQLSSTSFFDHLFATGTASHTVPLVSRRPLELLPGVYSFNPDVLEFIRALSNELNEEFPVSLDDDMFTDTGIHTTFDRLRCPAGYFMNPMSYVPVDNEAYRAELGLPAMTDQQRKISLEVWRLVWSHAKPTPVNVAKLSTSGMRRFTSDTQWKLAFAQWLFEPNRFEDMLTKVADGDWLSLANEYETCFAMYLQKRGQVDTPGKERLVFDKKYALSGGKSGSAFASDKKVVIDGRTYDDFSAIRARVVQAGPWAINCYLQAVATPTMRAIFERYPNTFHVNTPEQIKSICDGKYVYCSDVTEYDRSMSRDDIWIAHETMAERWDERIMRASWRLYTSPYYAKPLSLQGGKGTWIGDPRDWDKEFNSGNRSGHALTSLVAKVNKVIDTLCIIDHIYPVQGRCEWYLKGNGPMGIVNNGDDEIVWAHDRRDIKRFAQLRGQTQLGRYVVKPEEGQGFSGMLLVRKGPTTYEPSPRIHTSFEKLWVPERSIGGFHREFWPIGVVERIHNLMKTPQGQRAWDIHMRLYRDRLAPVYGDFMTLVMKAHESMKIDASSLSHLDKEVLEDPDKLHYKYSVDEVSSNVVAAVTSKIPLSVVEGFINRHFRGNTI